MYDNDDFKNVIVMQVILSSRYVIVKLRLLQYMH